MDTGEGAVEVWLEEGASTREQDAVRQARAKSDFLDSVVEASYAWRSAGELPWVLVVVVGVPVGTFFRGFYVKAGEGTWIAFKHWAASIMPLAGRVLRLQAR
jgi:hypothetical protein